jgi:hypothetical protein
VNREDLERFVPELLEARYPGRAQKMGGDGDNEPGLPGIGGWMLSFDGCVLTASVSRSSHPFIWIRGGVAHAIPRSEELALRVAAGNKDLVVGRLYMAYGDDLAMVVFDETVFGDYLSLQHEPSIQNAVNKLETSIQYTAEWAKTVREEFGGHSFTPDDWHLLTI